MISERTSAVSSEREVYRHLATISSEILSLQKILGQLETQEAQLLGALEELGSNRGNLNARVRSLESAVKGASNCALKEAEEGEELRETFKKEKMELEKQIRELEELIATRDAATQQSEEQMKLQIAGLEEQIAEKNNLLRIRDNLLRDLKSTADTMQFLANGLASLSDGEIVTLDDVQVDDKEKATDAPNAAVGNMSLEIEKLRAELHDRDLALGAKEMELEMMKEQMEARIEELENHLSHEKPKKSARLVSFLNDIRSKNSA